MIMSVTGQDKHERPEAPTLLLALHDRGATSLLLAPLQIRGTASTIHMVTLEPSSRNAAALRLHAAQRTVTALGCNRYSRGARQEGGCCSHEHASASSECDR